MKDKELKLENVDAPHTLGGGRMSTSRVLCATTINIQRATQPEGQVLSKVYEGQVLNFSEGQN